MNYLKYTQYAYLVAGVLFLIDGITKINSETENPYLSFGFAVAAIGLFFFRRKFANRFDNNKKKQ